MEWIREVGFEFERCQRPPIVMGQLRPDAIGVYDSRKVFQPGLRDLSDFEGLSVLPVTPYTKMGKFGKLRQVEKERGYPPMAREVLDAGKTHFDEFIHPLLIRVQVLYSIAMLGYHIHDLASTILLPEITDWLSVVRTANTAVRVTTPVEVEKAPMTTL